MGQRRYERHWVFDRDQTRDRVALLEDGRLVEYYEEDRDLQVRPGALFSGIVRDVVPAVSAVFVEILPGVKAFLQLEDSMHLPRSGECLLLQVIRSARADKAAQLSCEISLAGRQVVLITGAEHIGVSKKILDEGRRKDLRTAVAACLEGLRQEREGDQIGAIVRSRAADRPSETLCAELGHLATTWDHIQEKFRSCNCPALIFTELSPPLRMMRDRVVTGDIVTVCGERLYEEVRATLTDQDVIDLQRSDDDCSTILERLGVEAQLQESRQRRMLLPGGGSIVIDHAEALTAIDVNSGAAAGAASLEVTAVQTNQAAAIIAAQQIRLRNLSGIIIIDFIEMQEADHRADLMHIFSQVLARDPARIRLLPLDELGLAKLTRKQQ
ncbi:MAG: ribonuclease E/G [Actinomycetia bacterium]|nr:ribonuclease E/G [Actinomycetes bacterium]